MSRYQAIRDQFYGNRLLFGNPADPADMAETRIDLRP